MTEPTSLKYQAFLSYSHRDDKWAKWLHGALEGYRVDKNLIGRETPVGAVPSTLRPIFRDREDFSAGHSLNAQTLAALEASKFMIVLCSPNAVSSKYVNEEIRHFKAIGRADRVIPVIVDGEPGSLNSECFPKALRFNLAPDGTLTDQLEEPIAADARPGRDGKEIAKQKVVSGLLGVGLDEIMRRAELARRRHGYIRNSIIALLVALTIASSIGFVWARYELSRNEALLDRTLQRATSMVDEAVKVSEQFGVPHTVSLGILQQAEGLFRDMSELGRETTQLRYRKAVMLIEFAHNYAILGNTEARQARALEAYQLMDQLVSEQPKNLAWQSDLSAAETELGNALVAEGRLAEALDLYGASLSIGKALVAAEPGNIGWQIALASLYRSMGVLLSTQGKSPQALDHYRASLAIVERLAQADPSNSALQHNLALDHFKIGDLLRQTGKFANALAEFRASLEIRQQVVAAEPDNPDAQISLSWSYTRIGDVFGNQNKLAEALENHYQALAIRERVAATDRSNAVWQHDLLWAYSRVGDVLRVQQKLAEAFENDAKAVAIAQRLAAADPRNDAAQRDLSTQYMKVGDVRREQSDLSGALDSYRMSLAISQHIAEDDPSNAIWRCEITMRYLRMGDVLLRQKNLADALQLFQQSLEILQPLVLADQGNTAWQAYLAWTQKWMGDALRAQGKDADALDQYRAGRAIYARLLADDPENDFLQRQTATVDGKIAETLDPSQKEATPKPNTTLTPNTCGATSSAFGEL
jgi:tetratricopeptide (TPR) repeat protein